MSDFAIESINDYGNGIFYCVWKNGVEQILHDEKSGSYLVYFSDGCVVEAVGRFSVERLPLGLYLAKYSYEHIGLQKRNYLEARIREEIEKNVEVGAFDHSEYARLCEKPFIYGKASFCDFDIDNFVPYKTSYQDIVYEVLITLTTKTSDYGSISRYTPDVCRIDQGEKHSIKSIPYSKEAFLNVVSRDVLDIFGAPYDNYSYGKKRESIIK